MPVPVAAIMEDATKAVLGQIMRAAPPISMTMLGKRVAVISTFIECSNTPPRRMLSDIIQRGVNSALQPT
jgi:hypothetical protein